MKQTVKQRLHRADPGYIAFIVHRVSGVALAVFLPLHLYTLGTAIQGADAMQSLLSVTDNALFTLIESVLVVAFVAHFVGGVRLLLIDIVGWQRESVNWLSTTLGLGIIAGILFLLSASSS